MDERNPMITLYNPYNLLVYALTLTNCDVGFPSSKARELGDKLLHAFNGQTGTPPGKLRKESAAARGSSRGCPEYYISRAAPSRDSQIGR